MPFRTDPHSREIAKIVEGVAPPGDHIVQGVLETPHDGFDGVVFQELLVLQHQDDVARGAAECLFPIVRHRKSARLHIFEAFVVKASDDFASRMRIVVVGNDDFDVGIRLIESKSDAVPKEKSPVLRRQGDGDEWLRYGWRVSPAKSAHLRSSHAPGQWVIWKSSVLSLNSKGSLVSSNSG